MAELLRRISIVAPFYNEEFGVEAFFDRMFRVLAELDRYEFEIICVNDGSRDRTLDQLRAVQQDRPEIVIVDLTRNFGKEAALTAGLDHASGDAVVFIDSDLQHPPELIADLLEKWDKDGAPVVLARRQSRTTDDWLHRNSANVFYRLHNAISEIDMPINVGDFRLVDRVVVEQMKLLPESRRFMKGLFAWVGYQPAYVDYQVAPRVHGRTSFNEWRSWNLAVEGITSFSTAPLRLWSYVGLLFALLGFIYGTWIVLQVLIAGVDVPGFPSVVTAVLFLGGIQLIGIGILGEYVGRAYLEAKRRPTYLVQRVYGPTRPTRSPGLR
jgi:glycosyltransferase involved in cell wall biosynthesis